MDMYMIFLLIIITIDVRDIIDIHKYLMKKT